MKRSIIATIVIALAMLFTFANVGIISAQQTQTVEDQFWDAVKSSTKAEDFKSYLKEYPNGKYAAIARLKINGNGNTAPNNSGNRSIIPVSASLTLQSGIQKGANGRNRIPVNRNDPAYTVEKLDLNPAIYLDVKFSDGTKIGPHDYHKLYADNVIFDDVSGDPNDLIQVSYWEIDSNNPSLGKFAAQLTSTGKGTGTAILKVSLRNAPDVSGSVLVEVVSGNAQNSAQQTDADFLNKWAGEVRVGLPEWIAGFQLTTARSRCLVGCEEKDSIPYLLLKFSSEGEQQYADIGDLEKDLKPALLTEYCKSDAIRRNIMLGVFFDDRAQNQKVNFWISPKDCSTN